MAYLDPRSLVLQEEPSVHILPRVECGSWSLSAVITLHVTYGARTVPSAMQGGERMTITGVGRIPMERQGRRPNAHVASVREVRLSHSDLKGNTGLHPWSLGPLDVNAPKIRSFITRRARACLTRFFKNNRTGINNEEAHRRGISLVVQIEHRR